MDLAYDHIVEESLPKEDDGKRNRNTAGGSGEAGTAEQTQNSLNAEIQDAYKAFSASPWGAKIGGFFGTVVKQVRGPRWLALPQPHHVTGDKPCQQQAARGEQSIKH